MPIVLALIVLLGSYLLGSTPFGLIIVKIATGKDVRMVESGRTGGTNVMRAAGFWAGLLTAILDVLKSAGTVWIVRFLANNGWLSNSAWLEILAPTLAVIGHNYSIFLAERDDQGRIRLRGGAGGASTAGGSLGLWAPSILFIVPVGLIFLFGIGYASLTTMSIALVSMIIFIVRASLGLSPWHYAIYGLLTELLLLWALRPNIKRLLNGTERIVGWRARRKKIQAAKAMPQADHSSSYSSSSSNSLSSRSSGAAGTSP